MAQGVRRYFGMKVCIFRGGCLTGPSHSGVEGLPRLPFPIWSRWPFLAALSQFHFRLQRQASPRQHPQPRCESVPLKRLWLTRVWRRAGSQPRRRRGNQHFDAGSYPKDRTNDREKDELGRRRGEPVRATTLLHLGP